VIEDPQSIELKPILYARPATWLPSAVGAAAATTGWLVVVVVVVMVVVVVVVSLLQWCSS
jgi:hypothetical protein